MSKNITKEPEIVQAVQAPETPTHVVIARLKETLAQEQAKSLSDRLAESLSIATAAEDGSVAKWLDSLVDQVNRTVLNHLAKPIEARKFATKKDAMIEAITQGLDPTLPASCIIKEIVETLDDKTERKSFAVLIPHLDAPRLAIFGAGKPTSTNGNAKKRDKLPCTIVSVDKVKGDTTVQLPDGTIGKLKETFMSLRGITSPSSGNAAIWQNVQPAGSAPLPLTHAIDGGYDVVGLTINL